MTLNFRAFLVGLATLALAIFVCTKTSHAQTAPTVTLSANPTTGISPLSVTLTWGSTNAQSCVATGGWTGTKALSGTETITGLTANRTFTLTCGAATGSATLTWVAPTQNTDGSAIPATGTGSLAGFELLHATTAAGVPTATPIVVNNKAATTYTITGLPAGVRYYAAKAFNTEGVRSDLSGTVNNTIVLPSASANASVTVNVKPNPPVLSSTITVAYELNGIKNDGTVLLGRDVGTIALGAPCLDYPFETNKGTYYGIERENVEFYRTPKSSMVVTKCVKTG
jgi:hypothetical protein